MKGSNGTIAVKIPVELYELIESEGIIRNKGDVLFTAYKEYILHQQIKTVFIEKYSLKSDLTLPSMMLEIIKLKDNEIKDILHNDQDILRECDETRRMVDGLSIYLKKAGFKDITISQPASAFRAR